MTKRFGTPGPRSIHPEIVDSPSLGRCGVLANLLFPRLVATSDDQGRQSGDAAEIRLRLLRPLMQSFTEAQVDAALRELALAGMVIVYTADDVQYVQITNWWEWQSMRRAYPSRHPAPPRWHDLIYGVTGYPDTIDDARRTMPRNAVNRGNTPQSAADRSKLPPRARLPTQAPDAPPRAGAGRALPGHAQPVTPATRDGAGAPPSRGGPRHASEVLADPTAPADVAQGAAAWASIGQTFGSRGRGTHG